MSFQVLIIDDDRQFAKLLELKLKSFLKQMLVQHIETLNAARTYLTTEPKPEIDLVIIDQHLPDGRGVDFIAEGFFRELAVLSVSSDLSPEIPGAALSAGATYFLSKINVSEPLFKPLVQGIIERNKLQRELEKTKLDQAMLDTVKTLVGTLRHEINNPLGAVLGAAYLLKSEDEATPEHKEAARLVETSGQRIKLVLDELVNAVELKSVQKAHQTVFHIPGDKEWEKN